MRITQKTVGLLIDYVAENSSQSTLGGILKRHSLGDADPGPDDRPFSKMSKAKRADLALGTAFKRGKEEALLDLASTALRDVPDDSSAPEWARELLTSLRSDGFACTATVGPPTGSTTAIRWTITPLGYSGLPVTSLSSDLAAELDARGFATASGHYDQAVNAFLKQDWAAANSQLRTTFESVLLELASRRTGSVPTGGGAAISALEANGDLPFGPNEYIRGLWKLSHTGGSHPGLSDKEDAHHRMYSISAMVGWLVRTFDP